MDLSNSPLYEKFPNGDIKCNCCQHKCVIRPGKLGICRARANVNGVLNSPTYGQYTVAVDPIEKKPLYHFFPGSQALSYGTVGCNFSCQFCQNSSLSMWKLDIEEVAALDQTEGRRLRSYTPQQMVQLAKENDCISIASTYNEPTISSEFSYEVFKLAKQNGLHTIYVTNGFESVETLNYLAPYLDAVNIDLKAFTEEFYSKICGAHLEGVCNTIKRCYCMGIHTEVTTLIIPNSNDSDEELKQITEFIVSVSPNIVWHVSAYHDDYMFQGRGRTPLATLQRAARIGKKAGLKYIYMGNVHSDSGRNTICPKCGSKLVDREWFHAKSPLKEGKCKCGESIPGFFEGARNLPPKINMVPEELLDPPGEPQSVGTLPTHLVLYASKGGTSKEFAEQIGNHLDFPVIDIASISFSDLANVQCVVFAVATYGRGSPPTSAQQFWADLNSHKGSISFSNVNFAILGCGSSSFAKTYCGFAKDLETAMNQLGAHEVAPICFNDDMEEIPSDVQGWISQLRF